MPLLQGLARLLELLSNWFNVTLGAKLLDHLKKWLEPEKLAQTQKSWKAGDEPKIAAGLHLFSFWVFLVWHCHVNFFLGIKLQYKYKSLVK